MKEIVLLAFDLDGTLTQHKTRLEQKCHEFLNELSTNYKLLMVCAGGCERVYKQMNEFPIDIFGFYGMQFSTVRNGVFSLVLNDTTAVNQESVLKTAEIIRDKFGLNDYDGEPVEFHSSGMITFPILGTTAPLEKKLIYDPDRSKRKKMYAEVKTLFNNYNVFVGGTSSFDIVPKPYCKSYALDKYIKQYGLSREHVLYFGDDYGLGGNDEDIYNSDIQFVTIDNYIDFTGKAGRLLL